RMLRRTEDEVRRAARQGLVVESPGLVEALARRAEGKPVRLEIEFRLPDGSVLPAEITSGLLPEAMGGPLAYVIFRDVSERRRLDDALHERQHLLEESQRIAHVGTWIWELPGNRIRWSDETYRLWGVEPATFVLTPEAFYELIHPADRQAMKEWAASCVAGGRPSALRFRVIRPDGQERVLEGRGELLDASGLRPRRMVGTVQDVTDEHRSAEALRASQAMLKGITDAIPEPIFLKDRSSRWVFVNPATLDLLGKTMDEVIGRSDREIYSDPAVGGALEATDRRVLESGVAEVVEEAVITRDGLRTFLSTKAPFRDAEGRVVGLVGTGQDITSRKRMEADLREREHLLAASQKAGHIGTWTWQIGAEELDWSEETFRIYGLGPEPALATFDGFFRIVRPEDRPALREWSARCVAGERPPPIEFRILRPDGTVRVVRTEGDVIDRRDGVPVRIAGTAQDVTDIRLAAEALERHHALLDAIINSPADMVVFSLDREHRYTAFNQAHRREMRKVWGAELAIGDSLLDLMSDPPLREQARIAIDRALGGEAFTEIRLQPDLDIHYELTWSPIRDPRGAVTGVAAFVRDVTARRRAEAERERLVTAIEQAAEVVLVTDPRGDIVYVNPAFEVVTGYGRDEALGRNPRILASGAQDPAFYRHLWETIAAGRTWQGRFVNRRKDGRLFTEEATISPVRDATGTIVNYVAVKRDVTRDLALEEQLRQSQKMEGIGRLAGGIAHDFNNILAVILSCSDFALAGIREGDPLRGDVLEIHKGAERAAALTRQLLAFGRRQVLQPAPLDLNRVIVGMEGMLRRIIGEDVDLAQSLDPGIGLVQADPGQVEQVILNLVVNARDAMPEGGTLTIETANAELDEAYAASHPGVAAGRYVVLAVRDTGTGMDAATAARIFEPFFTTKALGKGTGLGLSTVYGIARQSGGTVSVESAPGQGSTFRVHLPRTARAEATPAPPGPSQPASGTGETVLVVEDDEALRVVARRMLSGAGYRVLVAGNGVEALLASEQHPGRIDLVLTDVVMPRMSGRAFADRFRRSRPNTPVLFMSGYADDAGFHPGGPELDGGFIAKPFTQDGLLRSIREILGRRDPRG
ncbi:MAG: PAS domain S-box protein, partial [Anaeromyxobacteraceae bacterium]